MIKYYKHYFERLASKRLLSHTPQEPAFFYVKDVYNPAAFDNALRSCAKTPALLLEKYTYSLDDNNNRNTFKYLTCRFNILTKGEVGDEERIEAAHAQCELIAEKFIAKMKTDLSGGATIKISETDQSPKVFFEIKNVKVEPVEMDGNYYGVTVGFTLKVALSVKEDPNDWAD
jgi:hypothetical protein